MFARAKGCRHTDTDETEAQKHLSNENSCKCIFFHVLNSIGLNGGPVFQANFYTSNSKMSNMLGRILYKIQH